ncbi:MAG: condensation domain-containing protein, partial [Candidatus Sericytochromatia bacterium]
NYLRYHVSRVLKVPFTEIKADEPLKNLGIGSLMGMELYNKLKSDLQITLTISKFLKGISINEISEEILLSKGLTQQNRLKTSTIKNEIPLSFSQQRLLFIQQLQKGVIAYNIPACLKIEGNLNPEFIEKAVNKIIERHEILRTEFNISSGKSSMKVKDSLVLNVKQVDALGKTDDEIQELMREDSSIPFNFAESLLRTTIFKQSEQTYYILLTINHIIADGFSLRVFFSELSQIYISLQENIEIDLPSLPIQYSDYAIWQQEQINKGIYEKQITYWKNQLDNLPSYNLPFDRPRKDVQTFKGEQLQFILDDNLYTKIQNFSKKQGVTNFVTLLTAYKTLLYHFANQNDIIIGTPIAGRNEPEFENMMGLFLNMLALRSELKGTKTFNELLQEVSKTTLDAYDNQDVPFEKIVEVINPERSLSHTPVFQTIMALHASVDAIDTANLKINYTDVDMKTSKFDLVLSFIPDKDKLRGAFEFNTDLFDTKTIETLNKTYFYILEQLISSPQLTLDEIDLVEGRTLSITSVQEESSNGEKSFNVVVEKNSKEDSEQVGMTEDSSVKALSITSVHEESSNGEKRFNVVVEKNSKEDSEQVGMIEDSSVRALYLTPQIKSIVEKYPNNIAISDGENISLNYKQLDDISTNLASKLPKNKPVAIYLNRSPEYIISIISCVKAGITYLPLDPENVESKNKYILEDVKPSIILTNDNYQKSLSFTEIDKLSVSIDELLNKKPSNTLESVDNDSIYIIYTSGSTGFPKGVEVGEKSLLNLVNWHQRLYEVNENTRATQIAGVAFDATVWEIFPYITAGATLYIPKEEIKEKPSLLAKYLENNKITCSFIPTPMLSLLLPELKTNTNLKYLLTGGDRLKFYPNYDYNFKIFNHYGPTESTVVTTFGEVEKFSNGLYPSIGKPIDNAE